MAMTNEEITDMIMLERRTTRKKPPTDMDINMTAMIDVLFMLMIFLLMGTRFGAAEGILESKMPLMGTEPQPAGMKIVQLRVEIDQSASGDPARAPIVKITVSKDKDEPLNPATEVYIDGDPKNANKDVRGFEDFLQIEDGELFKSLESLSGGEAANRPVTIVPRGEVQWNYALQVYNTAWRAGYRDIRWRAND